MNNRRKFFRFLFKIGSVTMLLFIIYATGYYIRVGVIDRKAVAVAKSSAQQFTQKFTAFFNELLVQAEQSRYHFTVQKILEEASTRETFLSHPLFLDILLGLQIMTIDSPLVEATTLMSAKANIFIENTGIISPKGWVFSQRPYYSDLHNTTRAILSEPYVSTSAGKTVITVYNPLYDSAANLTGAFGFDINLEYLFNYMLSLNIESNSSVYLISANGSVVYEKNGVVCFENIQDAGFSVDFLQRIFSETDVITETDDGRSIIAATEFGVPRWRLISANSKEYFSQKASEQMALIIIIELFLPLIIYVTIIFWITALYVYDHKHFKKEYFDTAMGLLSRKGFFTEITEKLSQKRTYQYALVFFRVKRLVVFNERYSKKIGLALIAHIGKCVRDFILEGETAGHFNASNFGLLLYHSTEYACIERLKKLSQAFKSYGFLLEHNYNIQLAFGCYVITNKTETVEEVEQHADLALNQAADEINTQDSFIIFNENFKEISLKEKKIIDSGEQALLNGEFTFFLQGKFNPETGKLCSAEALARWNRDGECLPPAAFIPLFEFSGFITKLDFYVLNGVCAQIRRWLDEKKTVLSVAVNFSRNHLANKNLTADIIEVIDRHQIPHQFIEIEITETALSINTEHLITVIKELESAGITTSIDDFGSGYSSLSTLKNLAVNTLKIDREFFRDIHENKRSKAVLHNILSMAKDLNLKTVAEGIETAEQVAFLAGLNIDLIQGYYFGKPVTIREFEKLLTHKDEP